MVTSESTIFKTSTKVYQIVRDTSFIRGGKGGWAGANGVGVIPFCAPENGGLHKIVQPFLRGHVFLCLPISVPQKRNNTEVINKSNIIPFKDIRAATLISF